MLKNNLFNEFQFLLQILKQIFRQFRGQNNNIQCWVDWSTPSTLSIDIPNRYRKFFYKKNYRFHQFHRFKKMDIENLFKKKKIKSYATTRGDELDK